MTTPENPSVRRVAAPLLWLIIGGHLCITSFNYIIVRPGLAEFGVLPFAIWRFILASLALWTVTRTRGYRPVAPADRPAFIRLAILAIPLNQYPYLLGIGLVPPEHGALLYATTPVWVLIAARLILNEAITPLKLVGIPLAFAGVALVIFERGISFNDTLKGDMILLVGVWAWALYSVYGKPLSEKYGAIQTTTLAISLGTLFFVPWMPTELSRLDYASLSLLAWGSLAYMVFLTSVIAYTLWYWLMLQMDTSKVAVLQNAQPIFVMGWTTLLVSAGLGPLFNITEHALTPLFLVGAAMTLVGVAITQRG
ncbi:MAG: hypothetical protein GEEBNDBF_01734 [bacterium]|nr:hypothetical protein [bacterium]